MIEAGGVDSEGDTDFIADFNFMFNSSAHKSPLVSLFDALKEALIKSL